MSRSAKVEAFFGDGPHEFALLVGQTEELQDRFDCGLLVTLDHIQQVDIRHIKEVLRLGLIGGGMPKQDAYNLVLRHCVAGEFGACARAAMEVVNAAIAGPKDEPLGELQGERGEPLSPSEKSGSAMSTEPPPPWAGASETPESVPSGSSEPPTEAGRKPMARKTSRPRRAPKSTTPS